MSQLNSEIFQVKQLFPLHFLLNIYVILLQVLFVIVDALGKNADCPVFLQSVKTNSPEISASILDKRNWYA